MNSSAREQKLVNGSKRRVEQHSRLSQNDKKWDLMREYIRKIYLLEGNTLPKTMQLVQEKYGFQASPRKWKMKFKEWSYEKRLTELDMKIVGATAENRAYENGQNTEFFHNGILIPPRRIENFKRRRTVRASQATSPTAKTPLNITDCSPRPESSPEGNILQDDLVEPFDGLEAHGNAHTTVPSSKESFQADEPTIPGLEDGASPSTVSSIMSNDGSSITSQTISEANNRGTRYHMHALDLALYNVNPALRIRSLQRVYSPLLFRRVNEILHPSVQPDGRAIMLTQTKAEVHVRRHEFDEAGALYWKVIAGWRFLGNDEKRLEAQLTLGSVFEKQDRSANAVSLFMSTFIEYLDIALSLTVDSPRFLSLQNSILCLRRVHAKANLDGKWTEVIDRLYSLEDAETASLLSHYENLGSAPSFIHGPDVVKAAISLAIAYSAIEEFIIAESIFRLLLNSTSESSRKRFNTLTLEDRANANRDYAMHCHQRGNNRDCFSYLARALENCLEVYFPGINAEVTDAIKHLLKIMNRQLGVDVESASDLAQLKLQQVNVLISIINKTVSCAGNARNPNNSGPVSYQD